MKYVSKSLNCVICGFKGVDLHHIKTRKSGGSDKAHNLMPLCHKHHVLIHAKGTNGVIMYEKRHRDFSLVELWLLKNGWEQNFLNKWRHKDER